MVTQIPQVTNWSVTPQNGQVGYFTLMNTWLFESTTVINSLNTAITKINEAGEDINNIGQNAINAITFDNIAQLRLNSNINRVDVLGSATKGDSKGGTYYWDSISTETDNGVTIIQATGVTTGRWKRVDNTQVKYPKIETVNKEILNSFIPYKGALRVGGSDTTDLNDERNYWRGLPSKDAWGDPDNIGVMSTAFNRNGASFAPYSNTFGHDCVTYGTASTSGGAGSATGDPDNPNSTNFEGYCAFAYGKNNLALAPKSIALGEENKSKGRASVTIGYNNTTDKNTSIIPVDEGTGATALGNTNYALGNGAVAIGEYLVSNYGSKTLGSGINESEPLTNSRIKAVGFGANSKLPCLYIMPGSGSDTSDDIGYTEFYNHSSRYTKEYLGAIRPYGQIIPIITNGGGESSGGLQLLAYINGTPTAVCNIDSDLGMPSILPSSSNGRLGSASSSWNALFIQTAPIITSDDRHKEYLEINEKERLVAIQLKNLIKKYKLKYSIQEKGDDARIHFGTSAQSVIKAFEDNGLDAYNYSIICLDKWEQIEEIKDNDGNIIQEQKEAGEKLGIRYDELICFIISSL